MELHNIRSVDIYNKLGLKKAYFSRLKSGRLLPADYHTVYGLSEAMSLTSEENLKLALAYQAEKTDTKYSLAYKAFNQLYRISKPESLSGKLISEPYEPINGSSISGIEELRKSARKIADSADTIRLFFKPEQESLCDLFHELFALIPENKQVQWIIPLDATNSSSEHNMSSLVNSIPITLIAKSDPRGLYLNIDDYLNNSVFPYFLISENDILLISRDGQSGLYLNSAETVKLYQNNFDNNFSNSVTFMKIYDDVEIFLKDYDSVIMQKNQKNMPELYVIEKYPCLIWDVEYREVQNHINDTYDSIKLAEMYMSFMQKTTFDVTRIFNIFSEQGLHDFLNQEEYYEFSPHLTKSVSKSIRKRCLTNLMCNSELDENYNPHIIRIPDFDNTNIQLINLWSDGKMIILFNFESSFSIVVLREKSVVKAFVDYINALIKCGMVRSKEDTLSLIKKALDESK